jgi:hypothetical protein
MVYRRAEKTGCFVQFGDQPTKNFVILRAVSECAPSSAREQARRTLRFFNTTATGPYAYFGWLNLTGTPSFRSPCGYQSAARSFPIRIYGLDQLVLLFPAPALDFLLAGNRRFDACELFEVNQTVALVLGSERAALIVFVLPNSLVQRRCHSRVQGTAGSADHHVNVGKFFHG